MNERLIFKLAAAALAATALLPLGTARAQSAPAPQRVLSRGQVTSTVPASRTLQSLSAAHKNDRMLFGRIDAMHANVLTVRNRAGRLQSVDSADAIKSGTYSAPLFIGKLVLITGYTDSKGILHAQTITREERIDASTPADR